MRATSSMCPAASTNRSSHASSFALELLGIAKVYGAIGVLHGVDLHVRSGSIHALVGANGAGKSTLLKIAVGATTATAGRVLVNGHERHFASPFEARKAGIGMVFQERSLVPDLSTVDNIFLNGETKRAGLIDMRAERREARRIFEQLGVRISPTAPIGQLSIADQQMVEIAKALRLAGSVLILDEPTAALTEREVQRLFTVLRQIANSGAGVVYVSHRLAEVFELCDEVTVIRDGRVVLSTAVPETNLREIVEAIAGGAVQDGEEARSSRDLSRSSEDCEQPAVLEIRRLHVGTKLRDVSFEVRPGEILGVGGLAGSGRSTLLKALFGAVPRRAGEIRVAGRQVNPTSPAEAIRHGLYLIPEDRKTEGLVLSHSVETNLVVSILKRLRVGPLVSARRSAHAAFESIAQLSIQPADPRRPVEWLSGGNQQKVVLGKAFNARGRVLLLDEPTFGVDVRSRAEIRARVRAFADAGKGAIWVTSDLRELRDVADRILILADGRVRDVVSNWPRPRAESEITHLMQPRTVAHANAAAR
jgi:ribose transport system ATP-binding protein